MDFGDKTLLCRDCGSSFLFTAGEQEFFRRKGLTHVPGRCPDCRVKRKQLASGQVESEAVPAVTPPEVRLIEQTKWEIKTIALVLFALQISRSDTAAITTSSSQLVFRPGQLVNPQPKKLAADNSTTLANNSIPDEPPAFSSISEVTPIICFNCGRATTVPFKPQENRPVYCAVCYAERQQLARALTSRPQP